MMKRRSFLYGASALALGQLVAGCNSRQQASLRVRLLQDSIPAQLVAEFRKALEQSVAVKFDPEEHLQDLFIRLKAWKQQAEKKDDKSQWSIPLVGSKKTSVADLVTLGDYWLDSAIQQGLIQPLKIEGLRGWQQLPQLGRRL
jgi:putative spermidine/putrescine transport system substrate-binding protein